MLSINIWNYLLWNHNDKYLLRNKLLQFKIMGGCGCKNNQPQPQPQQPQPQPQPQPTGPQNSAIQEAVRKTVEKYYKK